MQHYYLDISFFSTQVLIIYFAVFIYKMGEGQYRVRVGHTRIKIMAFLFLPEFLICDGYINYTHNETSVWVWVGIMMFFIGAALYVIEPNKLTKSKLASVEVQNVLFPAIKYWKFKSILEVKNKFVQTYPRLTVFLDSQFPDNIIFDSSDFEVVNRYLLSDIGKQQSLNVGNTVKLGEFEFVIKKVAIEFLNLFDDYSTSGHTTVYNGIDMPYNIQIIVVVSKV